ncbi:mRNA-decapping enzyme subunit 2 [Dispira simplex]|nr:mRNA-decapping enzyme subunit 2 [Dispira simplex]
MAFNSLTFEDVLADLSIRFIINIPDEELTSVERVCFQIEQAHWYYDDFVRVQNPHLPALGLKKFTAKMLAHCPMLQHWATEHEQAYRNFITYKLQVPVCGAIILNEQLDKCLLVKGWSARAGWGFPRGKINQGEDEANCAIREVMEETGFDIGPYLNKRDYLELVVTRQKVRLYLITGIPESTQFLPKTRKEISRIEWCWLRDLPVNQSRKHRAGAQSPPAMVPDGETGEKDTSSQQKRFFLIMPFIPLLLKWVAKRRGQLQREKGHASTDRFEGGGGYRRATYNGEHPGYNYDARDRAPTNGSDSYHRHQYPRPVSRQSQNPSLCSAPPAQLTTMSTDTANHALRHILGIHHQSVPLPSGRSEASASLGAQLTRPSSAAPSESVRSRTRTSGRSGRRTTKTRRQGDAQDIKVLLGVGPSTQITPRSPPASSPLSSPVPPTAMTTGDLLAKLHHSATKPAATTRLSNPPQPDPAILSVGPELGAAPVASPTKPSAPMANLLNQLTSQLTLTEDTPSEIPTTATTTVVATGPSSDLAGVGTSEVPNQGTAQSLLNLFQEAADNGSQTVSDVSPEPTEAGRLNNANPMQNFEFNRDLLANCFERLKS